MISDRPYRQAMSQDQALLELSRCAGTQFDPDIVDVFMRLYADTQHNSTHSRPYRLLS